MKRCAWVNLKNDIYVAYHDNEWGKPSYDDSHLYEMLLLECFQAGLSWEIILNKRENFRQAFDGFNAVKISQYDENKILELLSNPGIIRCRRKIEAAINNAKIFLQIQKEYGSFSKYIWGFTDGKTVVNDRDIVPTRTELSDKVSKDFSRRGMKYVGSVTIYSYLQAIGVVNDHEKECTFR